MPPNLSALGSLFYRLLKRSNVAIGSQNETSAKQVISVSPRSENIRLAAKMVFDHNIEGWVCNRIPDMVRFFDQLHEAQNIHGDIVEIGIHHGKLFFIMSSAARDNEKCIAVDLFEEQSLNIDKSGNGSYSHFSHYIETLFPHLKSKISAIHRDGISISLNQASNILSTDRVRLFSIDGGHTKHHVVNDMSLAQELVVSGGIILLDDFIGPHWLGVTEGFFQFMEKHNRRLAPFMFFENKLFITTFSEHSALLSATRAFIESQYGDEIHHRWRTIEICGFNALGCA